MAVYIDMTSVLFQAIGFHDVGLQCVDTTGFEYITMSEDCGYFEPMKFDSLV